MSKGSRRVVIPRNNPVNAYTMAAIVRDAGLTIEQFKNCSEFVESLTPLATPSCHAIALASAGVGRRRERNRGRASPKRTLLFFSRLSIYTVFRPHHKPLMMHEFHDHLIRDSRCARAVLELG
jgi:hypothetical protein